MELGDALAIGVVWISIAVAAGIGWTAYLCGVGLASALERAQIRIVWHKHSNLSEEQ